MVYKLFEYNLKLLQFVFNLLAFKYIVMISLVLTEIK